VPKLSIIIVHYRTPELLRLCLSTLKENVGISDYEVIVVDSAANRKSRDTVAMFEGAFPKLTYAPYTHNTGFPWGVNRGLEYAKGEHVLILNYDILVRPDAISAMLEYMERHPDVGLLGPRLLHFNGEHQQSYFRFYTPWTIILRRTFLGRLSLFKSATDYFLMRDTDPNLIQTPDWIMGSALMVSRKALNDVGSMDERFFMYFEDVDWARRFWHNGYKVVYLPGAEMYHYLGRASKSALGVLDALFNRKTHWHIASAIKFFLKWRNLVHD